MTRIEAAAEGFHGAMTNPVSFASDWAHEVTACLAAADAHDAANGVHRVRLDDATVERAAQTMYEQSPVSRGGKPWVLLNGDSRIRAGFLADARAVLAAAVKEDG